MNAELLDNIAVTLDTETVIERLNMGKGAASFSSLIDELLDIALPLAKPKALFKASFIEGRKGDCVRIDGVEFQSSILRQNLEDVERVFPYIVTAGRELDAIEGDEGDVMQKFCLDAIKECILEDAYLELETVITGTFHPGTMAHMNPGSLEDWPLSQQPRLFSLFTDVEGLIGVKLTASNLMDPLKSVSGIQFPTELDFKSCKLCTRHPCPKRRAAYDPSLAKRYGKQ
jgi:hypothetical protein